MARRYTLGVAVGTTLAVSLTGCHIGDEGGPKRAEPPSSVRLSAQDALTRMSQRTNKIGSLRVETTMAVDLGGGRSTKMIASAAIRLRPRLAERLTISHMTVAGRSMAGTQEIILGDTAYVKLPGTAGTPDGKPWIRISLRRTAGQPGPGIGSLDPQSDPSATVTMLTASKDVRDLGRETVGGVTTTHYQGTYSMNEAIARLAPKQRAGLSSFYRQEGVDAMAFDLWVDGRQLPRKIRLRTPAGAKLKLDMTLLYTAFNVPVSISAPPRSQVSGTSNLPGQDVPGMPA